MRILIVEDDPTSAEILEACVHQFGYQVAVARNGIEALELVRTGLYRLVISDWEMPEMSGVELCRQVRSRQSGGYIYFLLLTSRSGTRNVVEGLDAGADDFITKPFQPEELQVRLRSAERVLSLESRDLLIFSLAKLAESRDADTGAHLERIRVYSRILAEQISKLDKYRAVVDGEFVQLVFHTSPLHDIGKVGVPDSVLLKPGCLTPAEFEVMKEHTTLGAETLDAALQLRPDTAFLSMARDIAWTHHEKYDGTGYPRGLAGDEIPLCGRIVALADVYDALRSKRVYKPAFSHDHAREIIIDGNGKHFDPDVVDAFSANDSRFQEVAREFEFHNAPLNIGGEHAAFAMPSIVSD
jgi:putative two-component system response regulator